MIKSSYQFVNGEVTGLNNDYPAVVFQLFYEANFVPGSGVRELLKDTVVDRANNMRLTEAFFEIDFVLNCACLSVRTALQRTRKIGPNFSLREFSEMIFRFSLFSDTRNFVYKYPAR